MHASTGPPGWTLLKCSQVLSERLTNRAKRGKGPAVNCKSFNQNEESSTLSERLITYALCMNGIDCQATAAASIYPLMSWMSWCVRLFGNSFRSCIIFGTPELTNCKVMAWGEKIMTGTALFVLSGWVNKEKNPSPCWLLTPCLCSPRLCSSRLQPEPLQKGLNRTIWIKAYTSTPEHNLKGAKKCLKDKKGRKWKGEKRKARTSKVWPQSDVVSLQ